MTKIKRSIATTKPVYRMDSADDTPRIRGYGAVFYRAGDTGTEFSIAGGKIRERLRREAFSGVDLSDVRAMFNHDPNHVLGRTSAGTMKVGIDDTGVWYEVELDPDNPTHQSVLSSIHRGDVDGSSFWFTIPAGGEQVSHTDDGTIVEITRISSVIEMGPVTMPAYEATTAEMRAAWMASRDDDHDTTPTKEPESVNNLEDETLAMYGDILVDTGIDLDAV